MRELFILSINFASVCPTCGCVCISYRQLMRRWFHWRSLQQWRHRPPYRNYRVITTSYHTWVSVYSCVITWRLRLVAKVVKRSFSCGAQRAFHREMCSRDVLVYYNHKV